jgi:hypothetical protein
MKPNRLADRRSVLKAIGGGVVGSAAWTLSASASDDRDKGNDYGNGRGIGAFLNEEAEWNDHPWRGGITNETGAQSVTVRVGSPTSINLPFPPGDTELPFGFDPQVLKVSPGTEVTWKWVAEHHSVTSYNDAAGDPSDPTTTGDHGTLFDEHAEPPNTFTYTFETPGTYLYFCHPHGTPYEAFDQFLEDNGFEDPTRENLLGMRGAVLVTGN